jgi:Rrf2 family cysteine metabolism transcriptional repressor
MLRVSSRGRYGVKAVFELATRYGTGPVSLTQVARAQGISEPYLEQLMPALKRAGLVAAVRGAQGGYELGRSPKDITVGDVVRALEGPIALALCTSEDSPECPELDRCIGPDVWSRIQEVLVQAMDSMTFDELVQAPRRRAARAAWAARQGGSA